MTDSGKDLLRLQSRWRWSLAIAELLFALAAGILALGMAQVRSPMPWGWGLVFFLLTAALLLLIFPPWRVTLAYLCRWLNRTYPALEESTELLLEHPNALPLLQRLQQEKVARQMRLLTAPKVMFRPLSYAVLAMLGAGLLSLAMRQWPAHDPSFSQHTHSPSAEAKENQAVAPLPAIIRQQLRITPPAYTKLAAQSQETFPLTVPEQSVVSWHLETDQPAQNLAILFNQQDTLALTPQNADSTRWKAHRKIDRSGFYQLAVHGQRSELYSISAVPDEPVTIMVHQPAQHTYIEAGQPPHVDLQLTLTDDYGITDAYITATLASGQGESVQFDEQKISFSQSWAAQRPQYQLTRSFNLDTMGMAPGDELYFYITATDTRAQESRSEVYFITLADTAALLSLEGLITGVDLVPEYFRSQRQIIIDIEKLLREQDSIRQADFERRSNNLGIDQKLLRLRYGKFLGEESETSVGPTAHEHAASEEHSHEPAAEESPADEHEHEHDRATSPTEPSNFGDPAAATDAYAHKHDMAEDATFFEPGQKAQLKAVLTEMWNAELKLRTFYPREALPYAYKALRLLKDLQQKSRAYVAKTAVNTPPLKPEKRLSGALDEITGPLRQRQLTGGSDSQRSLRQAAAALATLRHKNQVEAADRSLLLRVQDTLRVRAVAEPGIFLPALNALHRLLDEDSPLSQAWAEDIPVVEKAVQTLLETPTALPQPGQQPDAGPLSRKYFERLYQMTLPGDE